MSDRLTPRERFGLLVIDEPQDRVPIFPLVTHHAAAVAGVSLHDYVTDGRKMARAQIRAQEVYGHDFISIFSEVGMVAEALGSQFEYPGDELPVLRRPLLQTLDEYGKLAVPDFATAGRCRVYYDAIDVAYDAVGDRIPILAYVPAPFTTAMSLLPSDEFMVGLMEAPEAAEKLLSRITDATIPFLIHILNHGGLPVLVDPLASGSVISPRTFRRHALPGERRLIDFLHHYDLDITLHICGDMTPMLEILPETGADLVSLDRVDLGRACAVLGERLRVIGNYGTTDILLNRPEQIEREVRAMVREGRDSPKGYVAATGCEVPFRTPGENVKAFIRGAREAFPS
jgi:uroporphyrinogen decarboxylase